MGSHPNEYGNDNVAADAYNIVEPLLIKRGLLDNLPSAVGLDGAEIEQRIFESASYPALENRCDEALPRLQEYIRQYPAGLHISEAQFTSATASLTKVPRRRRTPPTCPYWRCPLVNSPKRLPSAPRRSRGTPATIAPLWDITKRSRRWPCFKPTGLKRHWSDATCHYLLGQESQASDFAARVMYDPATPDDIRRTAQLWNARISCNQGLHETVLEDLNILVSFGGSPGAEAQYLRQNIRTTQQFDVCETTLFNLIETFTNKRLGGTKGSCFWSPRTSD